MNIKELIEILSKYPSDMEIIMERMSDYDDLAECEIKVVKAVRNRSVGYLMKSHETMSLESKKAEKEYLLIEGN